MFKHASKFMSRDWLLPTTVVALLGLLLAACTPEGVGTVDLGKGRSVTFIKVWYEIDSCSIRFQIDDSSKQPTYQGCSVELCEEPSYHDYQPIQADNGNLIGILDNALDAPLLIMYDFSTNRGWPCWANDSMRDDLFDRLQRENPTLQRPQYWEP